MTIISEALLSALNSTTTDKTTDTTDAEVQTSDTTPTVELTEESVRSIWRAATWETTRGFEPSTDENHRLLSLSPAHALEVAHSHVPEEQYGEFMRISRLLMLRRELCPTGACTSSSCPVVAATGRPAYKYALLEDLFTVHPPRRES